MINNSLDALFAPRGIAVVGGSTQPGKLGTAMAESIAAFPGPVALINPRVADPARGIFATIAEAAADRGPLDLAISCIPAPATADMITVASGSGIAAALVCAGGFAEAGPAGKDADDALREAIGATGVRLLGPNTSGFLRPGRGLTASFVPGARRLRKGSIAVVAASGGVNHAVCFELAERGYGVSLGVGIGGGMDVTAADILDFLITDADTSAVALHVESVADGPRLVAAVTRLAAIKPVVALVVGRSDVSEFAASHTGALATSWRLTRAALTQAGAVVVEDERQLTDAVIGLSRVRLAPDPAPGVGLVTAQAGPGMLIMDHAAVRGVTLPTLTPETQTRLGELLPPLTYQQNPVDTGRPSPTFADVLSAVSDDPAIDLIATYTLAEPDSIDLADAAQTAELSGGSAALFAVGGLPHDTEPVRQRLINAGLAAFGTPSELSTAIAAVVADARLRAHDHTGPGLEVELPDLPAGTPDERSAKDYLARLGIAVPESRVCHDAASAHAALDELAGPVALKIIDAAVTHKSDIGGVKLGIVDHDQLDHALATLPASPAVLIEEMAPSGIDLIVGARRDPVFGPIVLAGLGGVAAEVTADVAFRLAPLSAAEAATMIDDLAGAAALNGWRGGPTLDRAAFGQIVAILGEIVARTPVADLEINPLRLTDDGLIALDAVMIKEVQA